MERRNPTEKGRRLMDKRKIGRAGSSQVISQILLLIMFYRPLLLLLLCIVCERAIVYIDRASVTVMNEWPAWY